MRCLMPSNSMKQIYTIVTYDQMEAKVRGRGRTKDWSSM